MLIVDFERKRSNLLDHESIINWLYVRRCLLDFGFRFSNRIHLYFYLYVIYVLMTFTTFTMHLLGLIEFENEMQFWTTTGAFLVVASLIILQAVSLAS